MYRGWLKLWRKIEDSPLLSYDKDTEISVYRLLRKVNYTKGVKDGVTIHPGQWMTSFDEMAKLFDVSVRRARTIVKRMEKHEFVTRKSTKQGTIVSICNWGTYQQDRQTECQTECQTTDKRPTNDRQVLKKGRREEGKKIKNNTNTPLTPQGEDLSENTEKEVSTEKPVKRKRHAYTEAFERFWKAYPLNVAKHFAFKAWGKIPAEDHEHVIEAARAFAKASAGNAGKFTPHPATWLNKGRYDDDRAEWEKGGETRGKMTVADAASSPGVTFDKNHKYRNDDGFFSNMPTTGPDTRGEK